MNNQANEKDILLSSRPHKLVMEGRHLLTASGINDVDNFDESKIEAVTDLGTIIIEGEQLHIVRLMVESGELVVEGNIGGIAYIDRPTSVRGKDGFFSRLVK